MTASHDTPRRAALLADVGGTHARFALRLDDGTITPAVNLPSERFEDLRTAATESLPLLWKPLPFAVEVREAAVAVAGPITGDLVELTNVAWKFSTERTRQELGLDRLLMMNDLAAIAWAIPEFEDGGGKAFIEGEDQDQDQDQDQDGRTFIEGKDEEARRQASERAQEASSRLALEGVSVAAVVAVGTGLGVATLAREGDGVEEIVLASEGGHRDLAASTEREWRVVERLRARFGAHVSVERAVCGQGLANLWTALAELDGELALVSEAVGIQPEDVTRRAAAGEARAVEAVTLFSGWLGAFAGDLALTVGARSGIWLGGGVLGALGAPGGVFDREAFRTRFLGKGRFRRWLSGVPVRTIDDPIAAFRGLARALGRRGVT